LEGHILGEHDVAAFAERPVRRDAGTAGVEERLSRSLESLDEHMRDHRIVGTGRVDHRIRGLGGLPEAPEIDQGTGDRRDPPGGERPGLLRRSREAEDTVAVC